MQLLPDDERFLQRALRLADEAASFASPNPTVGCVLASNGEVIGEGAHFYDNLDHAEIAALKHAQLAGLSSFGSTAYVTLEPCAHHGRTGPCAIALLQAGITRCVVATVDPNSQVSGKGIQILRNGGVVVDIVEPDSLIATIARRLNDAFAFSIQHGRPFVTLKSAVSLDGYIAPPPTTRSTNKPVWLTGEAARADVQALRHVSDALITGGRTILADNPSLTDRTGLLRRRPLLRVVLDGADHTPVDAAILDGVKSDLVIITNTTERHRVEELQRFGAEVVSVSGSSTHVDLAAVLAFLHERNVRSVLLEGGSVLNGSFLQAELVDKIVFYYSDVELGEGSVPFAGSISPHVVQQTLTDTTRTSFPHTPGMQREDVRITGYLRDPWAGV